MLLLGKTHNRRGRWTWEQVPGANCWGELSQIRRRNNRSSTNSASILLRSTVVSKGRSLSGRVVNTNYIPITKGGSYSMSPSSSDLSGRKIRFEFDTESGETMAWLLNFDKIITKGMGGTLPEQADLSGIKRVLDIACGPGGWALEVAREHLEIEVTGIDISESMIRFAKALATSRGYDNASFKVMDVKQPLVFADASFDLVNERTLYGVMGPGEWPQLLAECKRILRPGGIIRLTELEMPVTTSPALNELWYLHTRAFYKLGRSFSVDEWHIGINAVLKRLLRDAGFQDIKHQGHVIDISAGTADFEGFFRHFVYVFGLAKPFLLKVTGLTEQEYDRLYQHMQAEMLSSDFCGRWTWEQAPGANC